MKISICSDFHWGYAWDSERKEDSFDQARESIEKSLDSDLILLPGDLFDSKVPRQEVLSKAAGIISRPVLNESSDLKLVDSDIDRDLPKLVLNGIPLVAIHGTHERRSKGFVNPIQLLERMGYLIHLHGNHVVFEDEEGERVAIHGLSGVPERYAKDALEKMGPEPVEDAYNILLLHQSIGEYVYSRKGDSILKVEDLPQGFDLIIDGHIHWYNIDDREKNKNLVFPGSTITTQMRKVEAEKPKGFLKLDTEKSELSFEKLESARDVFYLEVEVSDLDSQEARKKINQKLKEVVENDLDKKPLVRLSIEGKDPLRISKSRIKKKFQDKAILSIKKEFESENERRKAFKEFERERKSIDQVGREILAENISKGNNFTGRLDFEIEDLFEVLAEGENDKAMKMLKEGIKAKEDMKKEVEKGEDQEKNAAERNKEENEGTLNNYL